MSRKLRFTDEDTIVYLDDLVKLLRDLKPTTDKFSFSGVIAKDDRRAKLIFTPMAWSKMQILISDFDKEVAWHGVVDRAEDETKDEYIVSDILVYPQSTNGTYVDMDEDKYSEWISNNLDAPWQGRLHLQGHSHVNMGTEPSGTDMKHQEEVLATTRKDGFKIFVIWNKKNNKNIYIYDYKKNVRFGPDEVDVSVSDPAYDIEAFLKEAHDMVKTYSYAGKSYYNSGNGTYDYPGYGYGNTQPSGYGGAYYGQQKAGPATPAAKTPNTQTAKPSAQSIIPAANTATSKQKVPTPKSWQAGGWETE